MTSSIQRRGRLSPRRLGDSNTIKGEVTTLRRYFKWNGYSQILKKSRWAARLPRTP